MVAAARGAHHAAVGRRTAARGMGPPAVRAGAACGWVRPGAAMGAAATVAAARAVGARAEAALGAAAMGAAAMGAAAMRAVRRP